MGLVKVWRDRKRVSPHRPKRARTWFLAVTLLLVLAAMVLLGRFS